jgi:hypothetical protein
VHVIARTRSVIIERARFMRSLSSAGPGLGGATSTRSPLPAGQVRPEAVTDPVAVPERCNGLVRNRTQRCSRPAVGITGLCRQHRVLGCEAPWNGWDTDGVPIGRLRTVVGTRDGGLGCA